MMTGNTLDRRAPRNAPCLSPCAASTLDQSWLRKQNKGAEEAALAGTEEGGGGRGGNAKGSSDSEAGRALPQRTYRVSPLHAISEVVASSRSVSLRRAVFSSTATSPTSDEIAARERLTNALFVKQTLRGKVVGLRKSET